MLPNNVISVKSPILPVKTPGYGNIRRIPPRRWQTNTKMDGNPDDLKMTEELFDDLLDFFGLFWSMYTHPKQELTF